jgi:Fe-S-cluster-containing dehydrogenase component
VCPTDALDRHPETGAIMVDPEACINCELCRTECTYQVIVMDDVGVPMMCDLCGGSPACVASCYPGALTLAEVGEDEAETFRPFHEVLNERRIGKHIEPPDELIQLGGLKIE